MFLIKIAVLGLGLLVCQMWLCLLSKNNLLNYSYSVKCSATVIFDLGFMKFLVESYVFLDKSSIV